LHPGGGRRPFSPWSSFDRMRKRGKDRLQILTHRLGAAGRLTMRVHPGCRPRRAIAWHEASPALPACAHRLWAGPGIRALMTYARSLGRYVARGKSGARRWSTPRSSASSSARARPAGCRQWPGRSSGTMASRSTWAPRRSVTRSPDSRAAQVPSTHRRDPRSLMVRDADSQSSRFRCTPPLLFQKDPPGAADAVFRNAVVDVEFAVRHARTRS